MYFLQLKIQKSVFHGGCIGLGFAAQQNETNNKKKWTIFFPQNSIPEGGIGKKHMHFKQLIKNIL